MAIVFSNKFLEALHDKIIIYTIISMVSALSLLTLMFIS